MVNLQMSCFTKLHFIDLYYLHLVYPPDLGPGRETIARPDWTEPESTIRRFSLSLHYNWCARVFLQILPLP